MITQEKLKELLHYNYKTGVFTWLGKTKRTKIGSIAGSLDKKGYSIICIHSKKYGAHKLSWLYINGKWPKEQLDHINGIKNDNRINNLREATNTENQRNCGLRINNTSGFKGVFWNKQRNRWQAVCWVHNKNKFLGLFKDINDAVLARNTFAKEYHGEFYHP